MDECRKMDDWTTEPYIDPYEEYHKRQCLRTKKTVEFIAQHPEGATHKDFDEAELKLYGLGRLVKLKIIKGIQIRHPEEGPRNFHWLWKINKDENK